MFYELMRRRGPFCFDAFDLVWLDGSDLRDRPLLERKRLLRKLLPRQGPAVLYVDHVRSGMDLFRVVCERDMEGIVAKQAALPTRRTQRRGSRSRTAYSQAIGRAGKSIEVKVSSWPRTLEAAPSARLSAKT
jgi:ATP-dependent DNA ligase